MGSYSLACGATALALRGMVCHSFRTTFFFYLVHFALSSHHCSGLKEFAHRKDLFSTVCSSVRLGIGVTHVSSTCVTHVSSLNTRPAVRRGMARGSSGDSVCGREWAADARLSVECMRPLADALLGKPAVAHNQSFVARNDSRVQALKARRWDDGSHRLSEVARASRATGSNGQKPA